MIEVGRRRQQAGPKAASVKRRWINTPAQATRANARPHCAIVVLADGRIAERGDHAPQGADGEYARLFRLQASGYEAEAAPGAADEPATLPARR
jgi:ATP-binding cassette subfamily B protein